jgi:hypothetical protein
MACQRSASQQSSLQPHRQPVQRRMKSAALPGQRDTSGLGLVLLLGCRPATRRPTATSTQHWWIAAVCGERLRRKGQGQQAPTNGSELRKQSLKTEVTGPRGPETALRCPRSRRRKRSQPAAPPQAACQRARWSPRTGLALHASWCPTRSRRSHVRPLGRIGEARLGSGAPRSLQHRSPPADCRAGCWCWLLGLQQPHVGSLGALRPPL